MPTGLIERRPSTSEPLLGSYRGQPGRSTFPRRCRYRATSQQSSAQARPADHPRRRSDSGLRGKPGWSRRGTSRHTRSGASEGARGSEARRQGCGRSDRTSLAVERRRALAAWRLSSSTREWAFSSGLPEPASRWSSGRLHFLGAAPVDPRLRRRSGRRPDARLVFHRTPSRGIPREPIACTNAVLRRAADTPPT